ncbi:MULTISPECIES: hypothetical protein [unclassified Crossiella]|uniref:hypothetical protein n=1 Tax=unclassified Crossiella TaxID=2620835 RepID=UPI001FFF3266|nr:MULTISPECIES: hypothetical protein [unclassified Crossiella]MCK2245215.1 hypothetical protein [Crossiella sp. S99.2]MCK2258863.1 hypothetical protein [Crossiella sp. S99.1]
MTEATDNEFLEHDRHGLYAEHPQGEARFAVAYPDYPGGEAAYWKDFAAAAATYYTTEELEGRRSPEQYAEEQARYALKRRVDEIAHQVADAAGISYHDLCHWLVKDQGFPWRNDCDFGQLRTLLEFLQAPDTVGKARQAPDYPVRIPAAMVRAAGAYWGRRRAERSIGG